MIRQEAALKLAAQILSGRHQRLEVNEKMVEMIARVIMLAVEMDEIRQRTEKIPPTASTEQS